MPDNIVVQNRMIDASNVFLDTLWQTCGADERLYVIVDGAQDDSIATMLRDTGDAWNSLYAMDVPDDLKAVGPWLFQLKKDDPLTAWCINEGLNNNWFIIFASKNKMMSHLRHHFRRFAVVKDEVGKYLYFRYYDPRVLRSYVPSCNAEEREYVFAHIPCFWVNSQDQDTMLQLFSDGRIADVDIGRVLAKLRQVDNVIIADSMDESTVLLSVAQRQALLKKIKSERMDSIIRRKVVPAPAFDPVSDINAKVGDPDDATVMMSVEQVQAQFKQRKSEKVDSIIRRKIVPAPALDSGLDIDGKVNDDSGDDTVMLSAEQRQALFKQRKSESMESVFRRKVEVDDDGGDATVMMSAAQYRQQQKQQKQRQRNSEMESNRFSEAAAQKQTLSQPQQDATVERDVRAAKTAERALDGKQEQSGEAKLVPAGAKDAEPDTGETSKPPSVRSKMLQRLKQLGRRDKKKN
ncbi:MAG: hypothetical protein ACI8O8_000048 [Oleiphilaceae bacterium]|jgi:hypothetical protein